MFSTTDQPMSSKDIDNLFTTLVRDFQSIPKATDTLQVRASTSQAPHSTNTLEDNSECLLNAPSLQATVPPTPMDGLSEQNQSMCTKVNQHETNSSSSLSPQPVPTPSSQSTYSTPPQRSPDNVFIDSPPRRVAKALPELPFKVPNFFTSKKVSFAPVLPKNLEKGSKCAPRKRIRTDPRSPPFPHKNPKLATPNSPQPLQSTVDSRNDIIEISSE